MDHCSKWIRVLFLEWDREHEAGWIGKWEVSVELGEGKEYAQNTVQENMFNKRKQSIIVKRHDSMQQAWWQEQIIENSTLQM